MKKILFMMAATAIFTLSSCGGDSTTKNDSTATAEKTAQNAPDNGNTDGAPNTGNTDTQKSETPAPAQTSFDLANITLPSQLKGKVELVEADLSAGKYGPEMSITFKLLEKVPTAGLVSEGGQMWIVGAGLNEKGAEVKTLMPTYKEWRTSDSEGSSFKNFLESDPGETITMEFNGASGDEWAVEQVPNLNVNEELKKVKKFKLFLTK